MRRFVALLGVVGFLIAAAGPAAADDDQARPFRGTTSGYGMVVPDAACPPVGLRSVFTLTGNATHMGAITVDNHHCAPPGAVVQGGDMTIVAANGDEVFIEYTAVAPIVGPDPMLVVAEMEFTIVGGTGRFEQAGGGGHQTYRIEWPGFSPNRWPTTKVIEGTISY
jgi:hypothetical protein